MRVASVFAVLAAGLATGCLAGAPAKPGATSAGAVPASASPAADNSIDGRIAHYAALYGVPADLVRRVVARESNFDPAAYNGGHWGLMQLKYQTARTMGYEGAPEGLLDADANLRYGVKYLAGAYLVAGGNAARAENLYRRGYYYDAKRLGLLEETGLRP